MVVSTLSPTPLPTVSELAAAIAPSIASKQPGSEKLLSTLAAEAALAVMPKNPKDFNVDTVRVVKVLGGGLSASRVVKGMVFGREAEGMHINLLRTAELTSRCHQKRYKGQSCGLHLWSRYLADRDQGYGSAQESRRAIGLYSRRGEAARGRELMFIL
jgi:hypothetical protein